MNQSIPDYSTNGSRFLKIVDMFLGFKNFALSANKSYENFKVEKQLAPIDFMVEM